MATTGPARLPAGAEFSPGQVRLREVLDLVAAHEGDRAGLTEAIRGRYFSAAAAARASDPDAQAKQQLTRAGNVVIGMASYGLYDPDARALTDLGRTLQAEPDDAEQTKQLAKHILTSRHGADVLEAVRSLRARNKAPTKLVLAEELRRRGFELPAATTHHMTLLNWLAEAGVVDGRDREIAENMLADLIGARSDTLHEVLSLAPNQRAYLETIHSVASTNGNSELSARHIDKLAAERYGEIFGQEDRRKALIRQPLEDAGWIEISGTGPGRGGKSGAITPKPKLLEASIELFGPSKTVGLPADVLDRLDTPLERIYADLNSDDTYIKGIALELLAVNMAFDLGLTPVSFRLRAAETGGNEVDLLAEAANLHYSRWIFQCKNTKSVDLKTVTRETGLADILHAHVIVVVTTGTFRRDIPAARAALAQATEKQIVLVDGKALEGYRSSGATRLLDHFKRQAAETQRIKRDQGLRLLEEFGASV